MGMRLEWDAAEMQCMEGVLLKFGWKPPRRNPNTGLLAGQRPS